MSNSNKRHSSGNSSRGRAAKAATPGSAASPGAFGRDALNSSGEDIEFSDDGQGGSRRTGNPQSGSSQSGVAVNPPIAHPQGIPSQGDIQNFLAGAAAAADRASQSSSCGSANVGTPSVPPNRAPPGLGRTRFLPGCLQPCSGPPGPHAWSSSQSRPVPSCSPQPWSRGSRRSSVCSGRSRCPRGSLQVSSSGGGVFPDASGSSATVAPRQSSARDSS